MLPGVLPQAHSRRCGDPPHCDGMNIGLQANFKKEHVNEKSPVGLMKMRNSAKPKFP
jgi:hypothetical protein